MDREKEILTQSISDLELERRWEKVRKGMDERGMDFLVMQNDNEWLGRYVRWFTDVPARNAQPHITKRLRRFFRFRQKDLPC